MTKHFARLLALLMIALSGLSVHVALAPAASAHPYVNGCRDSHVSARYQHTVLSREVYRTTGATAYRVNTRWYVYSPFTREVHYHNTSRACFKPGLGF